MVSGAQVMTNLEVCTKFTDLNLASKCIDLVRDDHLALCEIILTFLFVIMLLFYGAKDNER